MHKLRNLLVTGVLAVALIGGTASGAAAVPDRGDGPQTDEEKTLQAACQTAYDTMEWAKSKRQTAGDVWDHVANSAYWFLDNFCEHVDIDTAYIPAPKSSDIGIARAQLASAHEAAGIEPMDNPIGPFYATAKVEPLSGSIGK